MKPAIRVKSPLSAPSLVPTHLHSFTLILETSVWLLVQSIYPLSKCWAVALLLWPGFSEQTRTWHLVDLQGVKICSASGSINVRSCLVFDAGISEADAQPVSFSLSAEDAAEESADQGKCTSQVANPLLPLGQANSSPTIKFLTPTHHVPIAKLLAVPGATFTSVYEHA